MADYGAVVQKVADSDQSTVLQAALKIAQDFALDDIGKLYVLASAVELTEPSAP